MTNDPAQFRDATIGSSSGILSAILGWLDPLGHIASSLGAIATCIISLVMLYQILFKPNRKRRGDTTKTKDQESTTHD